MRGVRQHADNDELQHGVEQRDDDQAHEQSKRSIAPRILGLAHGIQGCLIPAVGEEQQQYGFQPPVPIGCQCGVMHSRMSNQVAGTHHADQAERQQFGHDGNITDPRAGTHAAIVHHAQSAEKQRDDHETGNSLRCFRPELAHVENQ